MNYSIEELVEDAFVAYLKSKCAAWDIGPGWSNAPVTYPAVRVHVDESDKLVKSGTWHGPRTMAVDVGIVTEAVDIKGGMTARERNSAARSDVLNALAIKDGDTLPDLSAICQTEDMPEGLAAWLDSMMIPGVWICSAIPARITRAPMPTGRGFTTTISVLVIAQPVAIGGEPT